MKVAVAVLMGFLIFLSVAPLVNASEPELTNEFAVIIDGSTSFQQRRGEAVKKTLALLEQFASQKAKRWERDAARITIVSLDSLPNVLWKGTARELKATDANAWTERFRMRSDFVGCTDVTAAFRLALRHLDGDPGFTDKYILVFSDLVHEPPLGTLSRCAPVTGMSPPKDFPWGQLEGVSVTAMWVTPDQMLLWSRAIEEHGMTETFAVHSDSESAEVKVVPPPRKIHVVTEDERRARQGEVKVAATRIGRAALWSGLLVVIAPIALALIAAATRLFRSRAARNRVQRGVRSHSQRVS